MNAAMPRVGRRLLSLVSHWAPLLPWILALSCEASRASTLRGQVIIAAHGEKAPLAGVTVELHTEAALTEHLRKRRVAAVHARAVMEEDLASLRDQVREAETDVKLAEQRFDQMLGEYMKEKLTGDQFARRERLVPRAKQRLERRKAELLAFEARSAELLGPKFYLRDLPPAAVATKTDANGKFALEVPPQGTYALVARAARPLAESAADLAWIIPVTPELKARGEIELTRDNRAPEDLSTLVEAADGRRP